MTTIAENEPEFMLVGGKICSSFEDVEKELRTYIKAHIDPNDISDVPIKVSINSHNVPTLSLVDLPGLIRNKLASQKAGIVEKIENLIYTYIANPKTVILAISPANNDIANSIALEKAREVDPKGVRTLGVNNWILFEF